MGRTETRKRLRLPRLSRGWRIVRNIGAALVVLSLAWAQLLFPLGDAEQNFRRMERVNLLAPSEVVLNEPGVPHMVVGVRDGWAVVGRMHGTQYGWWNYCRYPIEEGITVIPLGEIWRNFSDGTRLMLLAAGIPAEAQQVWMELPLSWGEGEWKFDAWGTRTESGVWMFQSRDIEALTERFDGFSQVRRELHNGSRSFLCTLRAYGPEGELLMEAEVKTAVNEEVLAAQDGDGSGR